MALSLGIVHVRSDFLFNYNLYELATLCYRHLKKYKKAEYLFLKLLDSFKNRSDYYRNYYDSLLNLGRLYRDIEKYTRSKEMFVRAERIGRRIFGELDTEYIMIIDELAWVYSQLHEYNKSKYLYSRLVKIHEDSPEEYKRTEEYKTMYPKSLNDLAAMYNLTGRYDQAKKTYLKSLRMWD
jgi:tetratricopeptide (TPR) repeat protein